ncbi:MAG: hypothetical protein OJF49_004306 [Ktedonobacterales bacterium]|jgi:hypothetical protein|nr:MAG: hypothetical protein OJF49_004306 [Ktedonobacterales bacterium]
MRWKQSRLRYVWRGAVVIMLACAIAACGSAAAKNTPHATPGATSTATIVPSPTPVPRTWNLVTSPGVGAEGNLIAVAASSATDAWAVGQYEGTDSLQRTLTEHWDGTRWSFVPSPNPGQVSNILQGVAALSPTNAWAVGYQAAATPSSSGPLIEHWNGSQWSVVPSANLGANQSLATLSGVAASSASDVWAVGNIQTRNSQGQFAGEIPVIEHWNGTQWSVSQTPTIPPSSQGESPFATLSAVTSIAANNVWAVGSTGNVALIEHWNGSQWSIVPGAATSAQGGGLSDISALSASDIWAVGTGPLAPLHGCGTENGVVIEHWNGAKWSSVPNPQPPGHQYGYSLASVTAVSANDVWAVGGVLAYASDDSTSFAPLIEHWNGTTWAITSGPSTGTAQGLTGIATAAGAVWTVGQLEATNGPGATLVAQLSGSQWSVVASPSPGTLQNALHSVAATSPQNVWAVGSSAGGTLTERWNGVQWSAIPSPNATNVGNMLNSVTAASATDMWAVGIADVINSSGYGEHRALTMRWDGAQWSVVANPASGGSSWAELDGVSSASSTDVWAVGSQNNAPLIEHWNGSQWRTVPSPQGSNVQDDTLEGVLALSPDNAWAVGGDVPHSCGGTAPALIEHWDGKQWSVTPHTPDGVLYSLAAVGPNDIWAAGYADSSLLFMHWNGTQWSVVPGPHGATGQITGIAALSTTNVWAVGYAYTNGGQAIRIAHWDGKAWSDVQGNAPGLGDNALRGIAAASATDLWAVGSYDMDTGGNATQSLIMRYTG